MLSVDSVEVTEGSLGPSQKLGTSTGVTGARLSGWPCALRMYTSGENAFGECEERADWIVGKRF